MCHQPPPHPKTQHPAPKLQPQVHHTNLHPSQAGACIPQACSPHPSLKPLHLHIPHIPPTPTQPHVRAPPGSMSVCLTWNAAHSQPRIQCTWVREGERVEHQGLSHVCGIPQHSPQPTPRKPTEWQQKPWMGSASVLAPRASAPNAQPHTHTAAPKQRRDNPVARKRPTRGGGRGDALNAARAVNNGRSAADAAPRARRTSRPGRQLYHMVLECCSQPGQGAPPYGCPEGRASVGRHTRLWARPGARPAPGAAPWAAPTPYG